MLRCNWCPGVFNHIDPATRRHEYHRWFGYICDACQIREQVDREFRACHVWTSGRTQFVYLAHATTTTSYKIGITSDVKQRETNLTNSGPVPVKMLRYLRGSRFLELQLHNFYKANSTHGEWFKFDDIAPVLTHLTHLTSLRSNFETHKLVPV